MVMVIVLVMMTISVSGIWSLGSHVVSIRNYKVVNRYG